MNDNIYNVVYEENYPFLVLVIFWLGEIM